MATRLTGTLNVMKTKHAIIRFKCPVVKIELIKSTLRRSEHPHALLNSSDFPVSIWHISL